MKVTNDIIYAGVDDHKIDLFESQYKVPNGMAYNSYVVMDEKIAVMDTVDINFTHEWLDNLSAILGDKTPDYLVVQHMEPDHSANIVNFLKTYPSAKLVVNAKTEKMLNQFFDYDFSDSLVLVKNGDCIELGKHSLRFIFAPMIHWPEVMFTYDEYAKTLFSADAFGSFGANDVEQEWADEARRYYIGIVGKYGPQVQNVIGALFSIELDVICPLHGKVLDSNLGYYIDLYDKWSSYTPEEDGIVIAYTSVYGNTKAAVVALENKLKASGAPTVLSYDLAREDMSFVVSQAFRYSKLILATTTYNANVFPQMHDFLHHLTSRNFQKRTVALIENGSWAASAAKVMRTTLEKCKNITFADTTVTIMSALSSKSKEQLDSLTAELCRDYVARSDDMANKHDLTALFKIGYGLYVVTSNDGTRDNGLIVNTVTQVADSPNLVAVTINKANYSHHVIKQTKKLNVNCLSTAAPFKVFENFGFQSGRNVDKFAGMDVCKSDNELVFLKDYINSFMSLEVVNYVDLGSHGMFICSVTEARVMSDVATMTYAYYFENVKPKPQTEGKKGYVCKICGYVHEGDELPEDFICPLCKHGVADFEEIV